MRFLSPILIFLLLASGAEAKILTEPSVCHRFYAKVAQLWGNPPEAPDKLPFDVAALERAIDPKLKLAGHAGVINGGLWSYSEGGRKYFVKSLGLRSGDTRIERENAMAMAEMGIGPKVYSFRDDEGVDYLIFDYVPGINVRAIKATRRGIEGAIEAPPEVRGEIRRSLGLVPETPWPEVEKAYLSELHARRFDAAAKLKEIRKTLLANEYYQLDDFQFMIHFEKDRPGVEIQVIDSAYFTRGKLRYEEDFHTAPLDRWVQIFENWPASANDSQLKNMVEPDSRPAAHH